MKRIERRNFMKLVGLSGGVAAAARIRQRRLGGRRLGKRMASVDYWRYC